MNQDFGLLIPKYAVDKDTSLGRSFDFAHSEWDKNQISRLSYETQINKLNEQARVVDSLPNMDNLYLDIKLDDSAKSKSSRPARIWDESNLEVVEIRADSSITVAGSKSEFQKFKTIISEASYDVAKNTSKDVEKTARNLAREVYAVSAVSDHNADAISRADEYILNLLADIDNDSRVECLIELKANVKKTDYEQIYTELSSVVDEIEKKDIDYIFANLYFIANLNNKQIEKILTDPSYNYVRLIKRRSKMIGQRAPGSINIDGVTVSNPETRFTVAIVDSGVESKFLDKLKRFHIKETSLPEDKSHGTFGASRAIFGYDVELLGINKIKNLQPIAKYVDLQVLGIMKTPHGDRLGASDTQDVIKAIVATINKFPDIKIYSISIAQEVKADPDSLDNLTVALDQLTNEHDVLFVVSAGNHKAHLSNSYDDTFSHTNGHDVGVAAPGDSINSLTIGSVVYEANDKSMAQTKHFPSPFSRMGNIRNGIRKPELVEVGGNFIDDKSMSDILQESISREKYGVFGLKGDKLDKEIGTSFSTPMITHQAVTVQEYLDTLDQTKSTEGNKSNLLRSLLVHSTEFTDQISTNHDGLRLAYGAGVPNFDGLFGGGQDRITIVYYGELDMSKKMHKLRFKIPKFLMSNKSKFTLTFAYNPPVDVSNLAEYNVVTLQPAVKIVLPDYVNEKGKIVHPTTPISPNGSWRNLWKEGGTCLHFVGTGKKTLETDTIEVRVTAKMTKKQESRSRKKDKSDLTQKYAFVLSVEDMNNSGKLRDEIMAINEFEVANRTQVMVS